MRNIQPTSLINMSSLPDAGRMYKIELAYAKNDNLLFGERIYNPAANLYLHEDLASIVMKAANICLQEHNARFILYDGLRTIEAQQKMLGTKRVRENPHWLEEPRLLSPPGTGGHPRGMAIDIGLEDLNGNLIDMGTEFDFLAKNPHENFNPAHRFYKNLSDEVIKNRKKLDNSMARAAEELNLPISPLPQEWWDFRFPADFYNQYAPISENDMPEDMRLL